MSRKQLTKPLAAAIAAAFAFTLSHIPLVSAAEKETKQEKFTEHERQMTEGVDHPKMQDTTPEKPKKATKKSPKQEKQEKFSEHERQMTDSVDHPKMQDTTPDKPKKATKKSPKQEKQEGFVEHEREMTDSVDHEKMKK
jgi:hypothetical protein